VVIPGMLQVRLARHLRRHDPKVRPRPNQVLLEVQRDARAGRPHVISPDEDFAGSINQERTAGGFIVAPQVQPAAGGQGQRGTNPAHRARREFTIFPEAWERFRNGVPPEDRNGDLLAAYARPIGYPKRIAGRQQPKAAIADRM
jgi:hypothetical protein